MSSPAHQSIVLVLATEPELASQIAGHLGGRARVRACTDPAGAESVLRAETVDLLVCRDSLPGETGIMFLSRRVGDTPWMQRILLCPPLEPELLLHVMNEARVFRCVIEPCPPAELLRHIDRALGEADSSRTRFAAAARGERPALVVTEWIRMLPRLALLTLLTCGGVFLAGIATLFVLYLLKSIAGIDIFADAHLSSLWR